MGIDNLKEDIEELEDSDVDEIMEYCKRILFMREQDRMGY